MSIKKLLGIEDHHVSEVEILRKITEAQKSGKDHIEIDDPDGGTIKIDIPVMKFDSVLMDERY